MPKMAQNGPKWPKLGPNTFYLCIFGLNMSQLYLKSDTDYPEKISKIQNFEHAQKGPKWPKLGPNTFNFRIFGLKTPQLHVKSNTDYPEKISKKSKISNMPKMAQNGQN